MEEAMPPTSWALEALRRRLLDGFREAGYELILPPILEHLDALLTGAGSELEQQIFRFADPASGRMLGVRADMTPQAARIAARRFEAAQVVRLCYIGTVLRTVPDSPGGARSPRQVGCELFGVSEPDADAEILKLMLQALELAGVEDVHLELGHAAIYRATIAQLDLATDDEAQLFNILQRKSQPDLQDFGARRGMNGAVEALRALMDLNGGIEVIDRARQVLDTGNAVIQQALDTLQCIVASVQKMRPGQPIHIDLGELRGQRYHTGLVFAAFVPGYGREIARGGRYDGVGQEFDRPMPATGFSADLNELLRLGSTE